MSNQGIQKNICILFVDDSQDFTDALAFSFRRMGYNVLTACSGNEAFDIIQAHPVDVVVSDVRMPDGDGVELLERLKKHSPKTPIILLVTGYDDISSEGARAKGAEALFSKPLDFKVLHEMIERIISLPKAERKVRLQERIAVNEDMQVVLTFDDKSVNSTAKIVNLSLGGMFITIKEKLPDVNQVLTFEIKAKAGLLSGNGIVRWVRANPAPGFPVGCGIQFTFFSEQDLAKILKSLK